MHTLGSAPHRCLLGFSPNLRLVSSGVSRPSIWINFSMKISYQCRSGYPRDYLGVFKAKVCTAVLKDKLHCSRIVLLLCRHRTVMPKLFQSCFRTICPWAALNLNAAFNLRICGNREDFLSTDPLASGAHNPVAFAHTGPLIWIEAGQHTHTHTRTTALTHILLSSPKAFVSYTAYTQQPHALVIKIGAPSI